MRAGLFSPRARARCCASDGPGGVRAQPARPVAAAGLRRVRRRRPTCERCGAAVSQPERRPCCAARRAAPSARSCARRAAAAGSRTCASASPGSREELEALAGEPVAEVTGDRRAIPATPASSSAPRRCCTGCGPASVAVVAFLDLDQELLAPRYRAGEQALALLARAARAVGGRGSGGGRLLLQTRLPEHPVVQAVVARRPDPVHRGRAASGGQALRYPPFGALAVVSGAAARGVGGRRRAPPCRSASRCSGPADGRWLVRAADAAALAD